MIGIGFLGSVFAVVLALVPGVNLLYFIIGFLFAPKKTNKILGIEVGTMIVCVILYRYLRTSFGWFLIYLACTLSALFELKQIRATGFSVDRGIIIRTMALLVPIVLLLAWGRLLPDRTEDYIMVEEKTKEILISIVDNDIRRWKDARHPQDLSDLDQLNWRELGLFREELLANNCLPEGTVGSLAQVWINHKDQIDTFVINAQYIVTIGEKEYKVTVQYVNDYKGKGIEKIELSSISTVSMNTGILRP